MEMIETLNQWDRELMLFLNYDGGNFQDQLWWIISGKFTWTPFYLFLIGLLWKLCQSYELKWKSFLTLLLITVLVILLSDQISSGLIKHWVERPRPSRPDSGISELIHIVNNYRGGHYGFVSSHAANTWGLSLWFFLLTRAMAKEHIFSTSLLPLHIGLVAFTLLNCYSRIYLGVHYPGDILGGLMVGTSTALFSFYMIYLPVKNGKLPFGKGLFKVILK